MQLTWKHVALAAVMASLLGILAYAKQNEALIAVVGAVGTIIGLLVKSPITETKP